MRELVIRYVPPVKRGNPKVEISYRPETGVQPQVRQVPFKFEVTDGERELIQWYLEQFLVFPWGPFRDRAQAAEGTLTRLGEELFRAVFSNARTAPLYAHVADDLPNTRIVVHADDPTGIALPWELLRDPEREEYGELSRLAGAFVRSQPGLFFNPPPPPDGTGTFNILLVISRPGDPDDEVPFQSVARPLLELFRPHRDRIRLDILRPPTFEQLDRVLNEQPGFYHVLHFDGHGSFPAAGLPSQFYAQPGAQGRLLFEAEEGGERAVTGQELGTLLAGKNVPVVLLNACQSGMAHPEVTLPSVGNQLLKAGARGVVAMAYSVYVQTAVRFMARLYERLINGDELARAVKQAREALRAHPQRLSPIGEIELQDWMVPVLFEAADVRAMPQPVKGLRLNPDVLQDRQATAGAEIDCPEPPVFGLVGRDGAILDLERAFRKETIVLLEGMAGVGKTETAVGFARWLAETGGLDGPIFFYTFERDTPLARVVAPIGQAFQPEIKQQLGQEWHLLEEDQRREVALSILRQVPCFLIWDNFEPVAGFPAGTASNWSQVEQEELRQFLRDLRGGETKVLITSRRDEPWLGPIYRRLPLRGLSLTEAQELAVRVLERAGMDPKQIKALPEYNDLLRYLQGSPFMIQLLIPELRKMRPDALIGALQAGATKLFDYASENNRIDLLRASLSFRLNQLDPHIRKRLEVTALFEKFVSTTILATIFASNDTPEATIEADAVYWDEVIESLSNCGLFTKLPVGCYSPHPIWGYMIVSLGGLLSRDEFLEYRRRFAFVYGRYGSALFRSADRKAVGMMPVLRLEDANLRRAIRIACEQEDWESARGALYGIFYFYFHSGRLPELEKIIEQINKTIEGKSSISAEALRRSLVAHKGAIAGRRNDFTTQSACLRKLLDHYTAIEDHRNCGVQLHSLGMIAEQQGRYREAEEFYEAALIEERLSGERTEVRRTLFHIGTTAHRRGDLKKAQEKYCEVLYLSDNNDEELADGALYLQLGTLAQDFQDFEEARLKYERATELFEEAQDIDGIAKVTHQKGMLAYEQGDDLDAEKLFRASLSIEVRLGNHLGQAHSMHQIGMVLERRKQYGEAREWYKASLEIALDQQSWRDAAASAFHLGKVSMLVGELSPALAYYQTAGELFERFGDLDGQRLAEQAISDISKRIDNCS